MKGTGTKQLSKITGYRTKFASPAVIEPLAQLPSQWPVFLDGEA